MKDCEIETLVLNKFYEERDKGKYFPRAEDFPGIDIQTIYRICGQLSERKFIKWEPLGHPGQIAEGFGSITGKGVADLEGTKTASRSIVINHHNISVGDIKDSPNIVVGNNSSIAMENNIKEIIELIKGANCPNEQKNSAFELLKDFLAHPLVASLAGGALSLLPRDCG